MIPSPETALQLSDRIKLPFQFDTKRIMEEVSAMQLQPFSYYDVIPLRAPAHEVDPSRPFPPPALDYADGSWTDWLDTKSFEKSSYLQEITNTFREHTTVNLVRVLRLESGAVVKEHTDPTLGLHIERSMVRLTIPVLNEEGMTFYLNGTPLEMKPGECWYLRLTDPHKIVNDSPSERINISIDVIPNEWVWETIMAANEA